MPGLAKTGDTWRTAAVLRQVTLLCTILPGLERFELCYKLGCLSFLPFRSFLSCGYYMWQSLWAAASIRDCLRYICWLATSALLCSWVVVGEQWKVTTVFMAPLALMAMEQSLCARPYSAYSSWDRQVLVLFTFGVQTKKLRPNEVKKLPKGHKSWVGD